MKCLILLYERSRPALLQVNHARSKYDLYPVMDLYSQRPKDQIENYPHMMQLRELVHDCCCQSAIKGIVQIYG